MAPNEYHAGKLGRFHRELSHQRWPNTLAAVGSKFAVEEHLLLGGGDAYDTLFKAHFERVQGRSSPKTCDEVFHRLLMGGHGGYGDSKRDTLAGKAPRQEDEGQPADTDAD